jgi:hypothetical protein
MREIMLFPFIWIFDLKSMVHLVEVGIQHYHMRIEWQIKSYYNATNEVN